MTAYRYDGTFAGFLTCAWDALEDGTEPSAFLLPGDGATLWEERQVAADQGRARRLYAALSRRVSPAFQKLIARGFLTCLPEKELALLTLIRRGLREGDRVRLDLSDPVMARVNLALTKMWTEWDHLKGFVRFSELDGVLVGEIEPKNRVLPLLAPHFAARYSGERLALYDRTHHEIFLSDRGRWKLLPAEDFRMGPAGSGERACRAMWRRYYDTIAIEGRTNPKCQSTHLPKRYRHVMTEFLTDEEMERSLPGQAPTASLEDGTQAHSSTSTTRT
mgnify:FL=1